MPHSLLADGIGLAETQNDRFLNACDTIIIDKAHTRRLNDCFRLPCALGVIEYRPVGDIMVIVT